MLSSPQKLWVVDCPHGEPRNLRRWCGVVRKEASASTHETGVHHKMRRVNTRVGLPTLVALCTIAALAPAAPAAAMPILATTIVLERAGGFAGTQYSFVVDRS